MRKHIGYLLVLAGIAIVAVVLYTNSPYSAKTRPFSTYTLLSSSWDQYKSKFINEDGRVLDYSQNAITTSEGQSYAMLRAVWMDDRETFDKVWRWTRETMKRPQDNLFGWRWGERSDKTYGFSPDGGDNSASDADSDIALALILAGDRWGESAYTDDAKKILVDMWRVETAVANGKRYLIAGNWAKDDQELIINPSYFAPYAWRKFAEFDTQRDWESLIDPGYELLLKTAQAPLDKERGVGLVPDWVSVNRQTGEVQAPRIGNLTTNYGYDAMRTPWRIGLDYAWNKDERALNYLKIACEELVNGYSYEGKLVDVYSHDGEKIGELENPTMYATSLGCLIPVRPDIARRVYEEKIISLYSNADNSFRDDLQYYEQNWLWFGSALFSNSLVSY